MTYNENDRVRFKGDPRDEVFQVNSASTSYLTLRDLDGDLLSNIPERLVELVPIVAPELMTVYTGRVNGRKMVVFNIDHETQRAEIVHKGAPGSQVVSFSDIQEYYTLG